MNEAKRREELRQIVREVNIEINAFGDAARLKANDGMAGKCFRTRNNYSCPTEPEDYWWLYAQVTEVSADGYLSVWTFEQCKYGHVRIDPPDTRASMGDSYEEISEGDFWDAWYELAGKIRILAGNG